MLFSRLYIHGVLRWILHISFSFIVHVFCAFRRFSHSDCFSWLHIGYSCHWASLLFIYVCWVCIWSSYWYVLQIADGTGVLETLIPPLLDICSMENVSTFILNLWINVIFQIARKLILLYYRFMNRVHHFVITDDLFFPSYRLLLSIALYVYFILFWSSYWNWKRTLEEGMHYLVAFSVVFNNLIFYYLCPSWYIYFNVYIYNLTSGPLVDLVTWDVYPNLVTLWPNVLSNALIMLLVEITTEPYTRFTFLVFWTFFPICKNCCWLCLIVCEVAFSFFPFCCSCSYELMIWSFQCTLLRDNVFIEGICVGKDLLDSDELDGVKDGMPFNEEMLNRRERWNYQSALQPHVNWSNIFDIMHQISTRITEENVRMEAMSIMILLFLRSSAYFEREQ